MPTILLKKSDTPGSVPGTANLTNLAGGAEVAVNTADKRMFSMTSASAVIELGTNPSSLTCADASFTVARVGSLTISSLSLTNATVTSATVTTLTGTSANITTVTGTTAGFSSANITQLQSTSATITTLTSTSANITTVSGTTATYTSATITNLNATSLTLSNLSISSANITTLTGTNLSYASATITTGNLAFTGTAQRITGDFGNATLTNRLLFQNSTANSGTEVGIIPNGTGTSGVLNIYPNSDPTNTGYLRLVCLQNSDARILSQITGTGTYLPMTFYTGGSERMRLDTSGNLGIGTTPSYRLHVAATAPTNSILAYLTNSQGGSTKSRIALQDASTTFAPDLGSVGNNITFDTVGAERMRIDSSGNVGIGGTADGYAKVHVLGTLPTSVQASIGFRQTGTVPSGTTSAAYGYNNNLFTQAASFTLSNYYHFFTYQNTIGAGSSITNQYGYFADGSMTGATNNYGFFSNIASGSNRWNFYANGTADNYFAGNVGIGTTSLTQKLAINSANTSTNSLVEYKQGDVTQAYVGMGTDNILRIQSLARPTGVVAGGANYAFVTTNGSERMRIDSSGSVLIGVTTATNNSRLKVQGSSTSSADYMVQFTDSSAQNAFYIKNDRTVFSDGVYNSTTASAANVFIDGAAQLLRSTSSLRYKHDVNNATHGLDDVLKLRSVTYKGINDGDKVFGGLIAEEVHDAGLTEFVAYDKEGRPDALHYGNMVALLVKAVQELSAKVVALEAR